MGFLTVVLAHNDASDQIDSNPDDVVRAIVSGMKNMASDAQHRVGNHGNAIKTMRTRHANDEALYVLAGNTLMEITPETLAKHKWLRETLSKILERSKIR